MRPLPLGAACMAASEIYRQFMPETSTGPNNLQHHQAHMEAMNKSKPVDVYASSTPLTNRMIKKVWKATPVVKLPPNKEPKLTPFK